MWATKKYKISFTNHRTIVHIIIIKDSLSAPKEKLIKKNKCNKIHQ